MMRRKTPVLALCILVFLPLVAFAAAPAADYLCEIGVAYFRRGDYDSALHEFNKALMVEPDNVTAKTYIGLIFREGFVGAPSPEPVSVSPAPPEPAPLPSQVAYPSHPLPPAQTSVSRLPPEAPFAVAAPASTAPMEEKIPEDRLAQLNRSNIIANTLYELDRLDRRDRAGVEPLSRLETYDKSVPSLEGAPVKVAGEIVASLGMTSEDIYWKRANSNLNEENWRTLSSAALNDRTNTYDSRIFDRLRVNVDTANTDGFNFHTNITVDPWSFIGKSEKFTVTGVNVSGDYAEMELRYWSNTGYTVDDVASTLRNGDSFLLPEMKVSDGMTTPVPITTNFGNIFNIPGVKIERDFQPLRELWVDYAKDTYKMRVFPIAYQDQAYTSNDPLRLSNHHIWWQESSWLRRWIPGRLNDRGALSDDFTKGEWDDSLSFLTRDSDGTRLTALRGFSFDATVFEDLAFSTTFASPKGLWQEYDSVDNIIDATRMQYRLADNVSIGGLYTMRMGFDENNKRDAFNQIWAMDAGVSPWEGHKLDAELATSFSEQDLSNETYESESRGLLYYLSFFGSNSGGDVMELQYGYDEIKPPEAPGSFFGKYRLYAARMDEGFDSALSNFSQTRNDAFWSKHIHFRRPQEYFYSGLYFPSLRWDDIRPSAIGDGIDRGRDVIGGRLETTSSDTKLTNLFDVRNVHGTSGAYIETVVRDEVGYQMNDRLLLKGLGIYHDLPETLQGMDPFLYSPTVGVYLINNNINGGLDPSLTTGSLGAEYTFTDWLALNGVWEYTNDCTLAYGNFPRGNLNSSSFTTYYEYDKAYRREVPFLYSQGLFPVPPYPYYNIFKGGVRLNPIDTLELYLDWTRNEFKSAGQIDDNINHIGFEVSYVPSKVLQFFFRYAYSQWNDLDHMLAHDDKIYLGHHNFFTECRWLPSEDDEFVMQYGEGGKSPVANISYDPFGGSLATLDTQHIIRLYYRRKF